MVIQTRLSQSDIYKNAKAHVIFTRHFPSDYKNYVMERLGYVIDYFPEYWNRTIKIGLESCFTDTGNGGHFIDITDNQVYIALVKEPDLWLIAHELMHGVQRISDIPGGEKQCDLYALARTIDYSNRPPSYLDIPDKIRLNWNDWVEQIHQLAKKSIKKRNNGLCRYIKYFENTVSDLVDSMDS